MPFHTSQTILLLLIVQSFRQTFGIEVNTAQLFPLSIPAVDNTDTQEQGNNKAKKFNLQENESSSVVVAVDRNNILYRVVYTVSSQRIKK